MGIVYSCVTLTIRMGCIIQNIFFLFIVYTDRYESLHPCISITYLLPPYFGISPRFGNLCVILTKYLRETFDSEPILVHIQINCIPPMFVYIKVLYREYGINLKAFQYFACQTFSSRDIVFGRAHITRDGPEILYPVIYLP